MTLEEQPHQIRIDKIADQESDDIDWTALPCPHEGYDGNWEECTKCFGPGEDENGDEEFEMHGEAHSYKEGYWARVDIQQCIFGFDQFREAVNNALWDMEPEVGATYDVAHDYEGDGEWFVTLTKEN